MSPDVVVDVGNTRVKWGRCRDGRLTEVAALRHDVRAWDTQAEAWSLHNATWAIAGVVPTTASDLIAWIAHRGETASSYTSYRHLPVTIDVENPESVGLDRLLSAMAAQKLAPGRRVIVVDAGSAVTVNLVDQAFRGGAIFPGLRLLSRALHDHTALLPLVAVDQPEPFPGRNTVAAIRAGLCAVVGGAVSALVRSASPDEVIITGGDGPLVEQLLDGPWPKRSEPWLNLLGLLIAAESPCGPAPLG